MVEPADLAAGRVPVGNRIVDLASVTAPVLLVAGDADRVVPPRAVRAGARLLVSAHTRLTTSPGGHLGVLVARSARDTTWPRLCAFLDRHDAPVALEGSRRRGPLRPAARALPPPAPDLPELVGETPEEDEGAPAPTTTAPPARRPVRRSPGRPAPKRATRGRGRE